MALIQLFCMGGGAKFTPSSRLSSFPGLEMGNYYEKITGLQKHHYFCAFFIKLWFFLEKITKTKKILQKYHYFSDFSLINSCLFTIKLLNENVSKNAIFTNSQLWSNAKKIKIKKWQNAKQQNAIETKYITIRYKYGNTQK